MGMKFLDHKRLSYGTLLERHGVPSVSENLKGLKRNPERRNETVAGKKENRDKE
jgi:hypothetical protein